MNGDFLMLIKKSLIESTPKEGGSGEFSFVVSSEVPDLVHDIVVQKGLTPVSERIPAQVDPGHLFLLLGIKFQSLQ